MYPSHVDPGESGPSWPEDPNLCRCGAPAGHLHDPACPYPIFRGTQRQIGEWAKQFLNRRAGLVPPLPREIAPQEEEPEIDSDYP